eukprot:9292355-Pyramimonas_sp.AAC.1
MGWCQSGQQELAAHKEAGVRTRHRHGLSPLTTRGNTVAGARKRVRNCAPAPGRGNNVLTGGHTAPPCRR